MRIRTRPRAYWFRLLRKNERCPVILFASLALFAPTALWATDVSAENEPIRGAESNIDSIVQPAWAVRYAREFWREPLVSADSADAEVSDVVGIDLDAIVDRVSHAFESSQRIQVASNGYRAEVGADGLHFYPRSSDAARRPHADAEDELVARFRTVAVTLGDTPLFERRIGSSREVERDVIGNTVQTLLAPSFEIVEHLEARGDGVHVTWVFNEKPSAVDPLVVEAELTGLSYFGETSAGHHWADSFGIPRVRLGRATAVDSTGRSWDVPIHADGSVLEVEVPRQVLEVAVFPLAIDPIIGTEIGLDEPIQIPSIDAAVAFNGTVYLVVWYISRGGSNRDDVMGVRVDTDAQVLDVLSLPITTADQDQFWPEVASNGENFLVVWQDERNGGSDDIYGVRIGSDGSRLDELDLPIASTDEHEGSVAIASNGTDYLVVWDTRTGDYQGLHCQRLSGDGAKIGEDIHLTNSGPENPEVASDGTDYLVIWAYGYDVRGGRVIASDGSTPDGRSGFDILSGDALSFAPNVASNGIDYLVVWGEYTDGNHNLFGRRVGSDGTLLDGTSSSGSLTISDADNSQFDPVAAAYGDDYIVIWEDYRNWPDASEIDIYGTRVLGADGTVVDTGGVAVSTAADDQRTANLVAGPSGQVFAVWRDERGIRRSLGATRIEGATFSLLDGPADTGGIELVESTVVIQEAPAVASNGTQILIVWHDDRVTSETEVDLFGVGIDIESGEIDAYGTPIMRAPGDQLNPSITTYGSLFYIAWEDYRHGEADIYGGRFRASDLVLLDGGADDGGVAISRAKSAQLSPSVAAVGDDIVVAWQDDRTDVSHTDIYAARVSATTGELLDGPPEDGGIAVSTAPWGQIEPAVGGSDTTALVAWSDRRGRESQLYGARIQTSTGTLLDGPSESGGIPICVARGGQRSPSIDAAFDELMVLWEDDRSVNTSGIDIYGARVRASDGAVLDDPPSDGGVGGFVVSSAKADQRAPAIAFNGRGYFAVWEDDREGQTAIFGTPILANGAVLGAANLGLVANDARFVPQVAAAPPERFFVVREGQAFDRYRVFGQWVRFEAPDAYAGGIETDEDTSVSITLAGSSEEDYAITFALETRPASGELTGEPPNLTYTPDDDFNGTDTFTFRVNDGLTESEPAPFTLVVVPVNDPPEALPVSIETAEDTGATVQLMGNDIDGDDLDWSLVDGVGLEHGRVTAFDEDIGQITYLPDTNYHGTDFFEFTVTDNVIESAAARVTITITPQNDAPQAFAVSHDTPEDTPLVFAVVGQDPDGDDVSYAIVDGSGPSHGLLSDFYPETGVITYTPGLDYVGMDSFRFTAFDAELTSTAATVTIEVTFENDAPVAEALVVVGAEDAPLLVELSGDDADGDALTFSLVEGSGPQYGALTAFDSSAGTVLYTPEADFNGDDSFSFRVSDSAATSEQAWVSIDVAPVNDAPEALPQSVATFEDTAFDIVLTGTDIDGDALSFAIVTLPMRGLLSGTPPNLSYRPDWGFVGSDAFTFRADDGELVSDVVEVQIAVTASENQPPEAPDLVSPIDGSTVATTNPSLVVTSSVDPDGDEVTYEFRVGSDGGSTDRVIGDVLELGDGTVECELDEALADGTTWWWEVAAIDEQGARSLDAGPFFFTVDLANHPPNSPSIIAPLDGEEVNANPPTLQIGAAVDPEGEAVSYRIDLSGDIRFSDNATQHFGSLEADGDDVTVIPSQPLDEGEWFWRAIATDGAAYSDWTNATFTIRSAPSDGLPDTEPDLPPDAGGDEADLPLDGGEEVDTATEEPDIHLTGGQTGCDCGQVDKRSHPSSLFALLLIALVLVGRRSR